MNRSGRAAQKRDEVSKVVAGAAFGDCLEGSVHTCVRALSLRQTAARSPIVNCFARRIV